MQCPDCGRLRHTGDCEPVIFDDAPLTDEELRRFDEAVRRTAEVLYPSSSSEGKA